MWPLLHSFFFTDKYVPVILNPKVVIPQDVANSVLHYRTNSLQQNVEMPPIAKDVVDEAGVQLIEQWINSLTPNADNPPTAVISANPTKLGITKCSLAHKIFICFNTGYCINPCKSLFYSLFSLNARCLHL